jgi:uncharacterized protein (DUF1501 family)
MSSLSIVSRRTFLTGSFKAGMAAALASVLDIPPLMKHALAAGPGSGKKVLFIWLRGANDALNTVIPINDPAYRNMGTESQPKLTRPTLAIPMDPSASYDAIGPCFDATQFSAAAGTARAAGTPTFAYDKAILLGNGFAALHPSLKFLAPVYNDGQLALVHRVGYPKQSRSHFDSQNYWENGAPNNNLVKDGILYRAIMQSGLVGSNSLTGVSVQPTLPLILRGSGAAMTNLSDLNRYRLLGIPGGNGFDKAEAALAAANAVPFVDKQNRELLQAQYDSLVRTLPLFEGISADMSQEFLDTVDTDGDYPYNLFPTSADLNGGYHRPNSVTDAAKYVVDNSSNAYSFFKNLKAAALVLERTDAIVAGTEIGGFDTHSNEGQLTGAHPNLLRRIGWALYALKRFFTRPGSGLNWNNLVVVTLSEFGRTTVENSDQGTDHAEAGVMLVAGGGVNGYRPGSHSGVYGCSPNDAVPWIPGPPDQADKVDGSMFGVSNRYLKRAVDYRSVFGEIIRDHLLGDTDNARLQQIVTGYQQEGTEHLQGGGTSAKDNTPILGELGLV